MALRGYVAGNVASGISISAASRYEQPVTPPTMEEFHALLTAADRLANSKNRQIARAWERYRPMLYLAGGPCQVKQLLREIRSAVTVGNPGDPCTGCNLSWCPRRKLDNAISPIAPRSREGLLTEPTAGTQP